MSPFKFFVQSYYLDNCNLNIGSAIGLYFDNIFRQYISTIYFDNIFRQYISTIYFDNIFRQYISTIYFDNIFRQYISTIYSDNILKMSTIKGLHHVFMEIRKFKIFLNTRPIHYFIKYGKELLKMRKYG